MKTISRLHRKALAALVLSVALAAAPAPALAEETQSAWGEAGIGLLCLGSTLFYGPVKAIYALAGTVTGGAAYALTGGNLDTARSIWAASLRGDYVISPQIVRGERVLIFTGQDPEPQAAEYGSDAR